MDIISFLLVLPFQTALRAKGGGCTSCERKHTAAAAGEEDAPSLPLCSLQLIDAVSLLPFGLPVQSKAQLCHQELQRSPVCRRVPRGAQWRLPTFTPSRYPTTPNRAGRESADWSDALRFSLWSRQLTYHFSISDFNLCAQLYQLC